MRRISCWNDLCPLGIECLTGEACGLGYRILFDVTEQGRRILSKCFGIPNLQLAEAWNRGNAEHPHVGSIMLAKEMLVPVGIFALLENDCTEVWHFANGSLLGIEKQDSPDQVAAAEKMCAPERIRKYQYGGTAGDRNVHMMSGRTV